MWRFAALFSLTCVLCDSFVLKQHGQPKKYAYITMAHDEGDVEGVFLLRTLPVVHALRQVTDHPIIVMTNATHFGDGSSVAEGFKKLNVEVWPIRDMGIPEEFLTRKYKAKCKDKCGYTLFKLQAWSFTQFDKLITFDTDAIVTKNMDELFELPGTWAQEERWWCQPTGLMSGGFVILEPSQHDFDGLLRYALTGEIGAADQSTISGYFGMAGRDQVHVTADLPGNRSDGVLSREHQRRSPVQLIDKNMVDYGMCMGQHKELPPFIHKSDRNNHCFTVAPSALQGECKFSKLAKLYRSHLCQATAVLGIGFGHRDSYC